MSSVSKRLPSQKMITSIILQTIPASIHKPTVHVFPPEFSDATRKPLDKVVTRVSGTLYNDYEKIMQDILNISTVTTLVNGFDYTCSL